MNELLPTLWLMITRDGHFYPIQPSEECKPEDHGELNDHVVRIEDMDGNVLWRRPLVHWRPVTLFQIGVGASKKDTGCSTAGTSLSLASKIHATSNIPIDKNIMAIHTPMAISRDRINQA